MTRLLRWTGQSLPAAPGAGAPGLGGRFDPPLHPGMKRGPLLGLGPQISVMNPILPDPTFAPSKEFDTWLRLQDYANVGVGNRFSNRIEFNFNDEEFLTQKSPLTLPLTTYSMRFYFRTEQLAGEAVIGGGPHNIFTFANGHEGYSWSFRLRSQEVVDGNVLTYRTEIVNAFNGTQVAVSAKPSSPFTVDQPTGFAFWGAGSRIWRVEVQVASGRASNAAGSQTRVFVRLYNGCEETNANSMVGSLNNIPLPQRLTLAGNPTTLNADRVYFGDNKETGYTGEYWLGNFEIHDDFDLGGQFTRGGPTGALNTDAEMRLATGGPYRRPKYQFFEWQGPVAPWVELEHMGEWDGAAIQPSLINEIEKRDIYYPDENFTGFGRFFASDGNVGDVDTSINWKAGLRSAIYWPTRTAPINGWPLLVFTHGGFWTVAGQSYRNMRKVFVKWATLNGFAVLSTSYAKTNQLFNGEAYPAYGTADGEGVVRGARYPSFLVDLKNNINYFRKRSQSEGDGTYPIDTTLTIGCGFSAGGYNTLAAAVSRNLVDAFGTDTSINANPAFGANQLPGGVDPRFIGAISLAGPTSLPDLIAHDLTIPGQLGYTDGSNNHISLFEATAMSFLGNDIAFGTAMPELPATTVPSLIATQKAAGGEIPPIMYVRGGADHLVGPSQVTLLTEAMITHYPEVPYRVVEAEGTPHDLMEHALPYPKIMEFAKECVRRARSGG